jgi:hypothetical protein
LIAGIGKDHLDEGEAAPGLAQQFCRAIAILHGGGMNGDPHHRAERVDHDMALAPGDLLARVVAPGERVALTAPNG